MKERFVKTSYIIEVPSEAALRDEYLSVQDIAPCHLACPVGINVKGYVTAIADGRFEKALEVIREANCLPSVCGRVCTHPCERECTRAEYGGAINIRALKRFAADYERRQGRKSGIKARPAKKEKVAIIGAGPAGLAAAHDLAVKGYPVTIFEKEKMPGGLMTWGIPDFRLPDKAVLYDIERIKQLGVTIETNSPVTTAHQFNSIRREYGAMLLAVGAHKEPLEYTLPGKRTVGMLDYLAFMKSHSFDAGREKNGSIAIIGLGQAALDTARTALRAGYEKVILLYPRTREEFQSFPSDIETAIAEGVEILFQTRATSVIESAGNVEGIKCVKLDAAPPDANRRQALIEKKDTEFTIHIDEIIPVEPHYPDLSFIPDRTKCRISKWGYLKVNAETLCTGEESVFAAGDAVTGPKSVIEAMAGGRRAAKSIHEFLRGIKHSDEKERRNYPMILEPERPEDKSDVKPAVKPWNRDLPAFQETEKAYSEVRAIEEARRCLRCGPCMECARCSSDCSKEVVVLSQNNGAFRARFQKKKREEIIFGGHKALEMKRLVTVPPEISSVSSSNLTANATFCIVDPGLCNGCGACEEICEYRAPRVEYRDGHFAATIHRDICRECGTCAANCPSGAITQQYFTDELMEVEIEKGLKG